MTENLLAPNWCADPMNLSGGRTNDWNPVVHQTVTTGGTGWSGAWTARGPARSDQVVTGVVLGPHYGLGPAPFQVDLGAGPPGAEVTLGSLVGEVSGGGAQQVVHLPLPLAVRAGERLAVRVRQPAGADALPAALVGHALPAQPPPAEPVLVRPGCRRIRLRD